jgi:regulator of RNase E activity RraA|tara:strand:+ start:1125 stop:1802 length:678 start_codon:yes stop_codon:yes gene_type:complete
MIDSDSNKKNNISISNRLAKCFSSVVHDVMRDDGFKNFVLDPAIKPLKEEHKIGGQIFTIKGSSNSSYTHDETLLAWTGMLSKAPADKVLICQPNDNVAAFMGELSAEYLLKKNVRGYIADGGCRDVEFINNINFPVWSKFNTPKDVVGYWKPDELETTIKIGDVIINNNDYVLADIDGVVIIPQDHIINILEKTENLISTESKVRKAIREGMDPQEAYIKFSAF